MARVKLFKGKDKSDESLFRWKKKDMSNCTSCYISAYDIDKNLGIGQLGVFFPKPSGHKLQKLEEVEGSAAVIVRFVHHVNHFSFWHLCGTREGFNFDSFKYLWSCNEVSTDTTRVCAWVGVVARRLSVDDCKSKNDVLCSKPRKCRGADGIRRQWES